MSFRSLTADAYHHHNFPALCRRPKVKKGGDAQTVRLGRFRTLGQCKFTNPGSG